MANETNQHIAGAKRTKLDDGTLRNASAALKDIASALDDVVEGNASMIGACQERGLVWMKVRTILLSKSFAACRQRKTLMELKDVAVLEPDGFEQLYMDVFNLAEIGEIKLPADFRETVPEVLSTLTFREAEVIRMRYGLDGEPPMTLEEIGDVIGTQKERAKQILSKLLRKLRHPSRSRWLEEGSIKYHAQQEANRAVFAAQQEAVNQWLEEQKQAAKENAKVSPKEEMPQVSIDDMDLSIRTYTCLKRAGKTTLQDLLQMSDDDFLHIRNLGRKCMEEVVSKRDAMVRNLMG